MDNRSSIPMLPSGLSISGNTLTNAIQAALNPSAAPSAAQGVINLPQAAPLASQPCAMHSTQQSHLLNRPFVVDFEFYPLDSAANPKGLAVKAGDSIFDRFKDLTAWATEANRKFHLNRNHAKGLDGVLEGRYIHRIEPIFEVEFRPAGLPMDYETEKCIEAYIKRRVAWVVDPLNVSDSLTLTPVFLADTPENGLEFRGDQSVMIENDNFNIRFEIVGQDRLSKFPLNSDQCFGIDGFMTVQAGFKLVTGDAQLPAN